MQIKNALHLLMADQLKLVEIVETWLFINNNQVSQQLVV